MTKGERKALRRVLRRVLRMLDAADGWRVA